MYKLMFYLTTVIKHDVAVTLVWQGSSRDNHVENLLSCQGSESVTFEVYKCCPLVVPSNEHNMTKST